MILVAGAIFTHNIHQIYNFLHILPNILVDLCVGLIIGAIAMLVHSLFVRVIKR